MLRCCFFCSNSIKILIFVHLGGRGRVRRGGEGRCELLRDTALGDIVIIIRYSFPNIIISIIVIKVRAAVKQSPMCYYHFYNHNHQSVIGQSETTKAQQTIWHQEIKIVFTKGENPKNWQLDRCVSKFSVAIQDFSLGHRAVKIETSRFDNPSA